jgi:hypothetical protein
MQRLAKNPQSFSDTATCSESMEHKLLRCVKAALDADHPDQALKLLSTNIDSSAVRNARAVCLLRLGRHDEALAIYRRFLFRSGCIWMIPEMPTEYKVNFATCLLLTGHPSGGKAVLDEIGEDQHPGVQRRREDIRKWAKSLSVFSRLDWWLSGIDPPKNKIVPVSAPIGEISVV